MKRVMFFALFASLSIANTADKINPFLGTWCVGENGLLLTFSGKDSLSVASISDSNVNGKGTYQKNDSTFFATINNNDIIMKIQYRYHWKSKDSIEAQAIIFTVNNDTVDSPKEWTAMTRCSKSLPAQAQTLEQDSKSKIPAKKSAK